MTVIDTAKLAARIDGAIDGEPSQLVEATAALTNAALNAVTEADRARIAILRAQVDRLRRRLGRRPPTSIVTALATSLHQLDDSLSAALVALDLHTEAARHDERAVAAPERLLATLHEPRRPGDLGRQLDLDPSQVSRGLRSLIDTGHVAEVPSPAGADRRGRWYQRTTSDGGQPAERAASPQQIAELTSAASAIAVLTTTGAWVWSEPGAEDAESKLASALGRSSPA